MSILRTVWLVASLAVVAIGGHASPHHADHSAAMASAPTSADADHVHHGAVSDAQHAVRALSDLSGTYRYLDGVRVTVGATPNGEQAVAYYADGRIVIDRDHTASIDTILAHEIWHVIDWRDNGSIDWGEDLPPAGSAAYRTR